MKQILPISLFSVFILCSWFILSSHTEGVYGLQFSGGAGAGGLGDRTGSPLSSGTCSACHSGGSTTTTLSLQLVNSNNATVTTYVPGAVYTVKYQVSTNTVGSGFQAVALLPSNAQAGAFSLPNSATQVTTISGRQYMEHDNGPNVSGYFEATWTAPTAGSGDVTFYSIANGVNGNGGTSGDAVSATVANIIGETPTGDFTYSNSDFCDNDADPTPTVTGVFGGTFSSTAGLSINSTTGTIDLSLSTPGTYTVSYTNSGGTATQTVTVNPTLSSSTTATICATDSIFLQGAWQNTAGSYVESLQAVTGCDSVVTTVLTVNPAYSSSTSATICATDSVFLQGAWQNTAGSYVETLQAVTGCDSIVTTVLTVNPVYNNTVIENICAGDSTLFNGTWYASTGMYTHNDVSVFGCDSNTTLDLTVSTIDLTVDVMNAPIIVAEQAGATYQWFDCSNGYTLLVGETAQSFTAPIWAGKYAVEVTFQNCIDTSDCLTVTWFGLEELFFGDVKLFPNPSSGELNITFSEPISGELKMLDLKGKVVFASDLVNALEFNQTILTEPGTYMINISNERGNRNLLWVVD